MPRLPSHCGGTRCCYRKYSSLSLLSVLPLDRQDRVHVVELFHCFIFSFSPLLLRSFSLYVSQALEALLSDIKSNSSLYFFNQFRVKTRSLLLIFSSSLLNFSLIVIPFLFLSSLRMERAAGRWRVDDEEELEEEIESAGQVDRVLLELEHQSVCQGLCTSIHPSVHLPVCLVVHPFVHHPIFSLARRNLQHPHLWKSKISSHKLLPFPHREDRVRGVGQATAGYEN